MVTGGDTWKLCHYANSLKDESVNILYSLLMSHRPLLLSDCIPRNYISLSPNLRYFESFPFMLCYTSTPQHFRAKHCTLLQLF